MPRIGITSLGLAVLLSISIGAQANPIQLTVAEPTGLYGLSGSNNVNLSFDSSQGGSVVLGSPMVQPTIRPDILVFNGTGDPPQTVNFTSPFSFELGMKSPAGSTTTFTGPWLLVSGMVNGSASATVPASNLSGGYTGTATSATLMGDPPGTTVPPLLLQLVQHPQSIQLNAIVTGGSMNLLQTTLSIDPPGPGLPTPAPEPSSIATFLAMLGSLALLHRRRTARPLA